MKRLVASGFVCLSVAVSAHAVTFDTYPSWGGDPFGPFGSVTTNDAAATVGQSFVAPTDDTLLQSFKFSLAYASGDPFAYKFYIGRWDGSKIIGSPIYSSGVLTSPDANAGFVDVQLGIGLNLQSNNNYIAFLSTSETKPPKDGTADIGFLPTGTYTDGGVYYLQNDGDPTKWSGTGWNSDFARGNFAFTAVFINPASVPEPASLFTLGGALAVALRRRRR